MWAALFAGSPHIDEHINATCVASRARFPLSVSCPAISESQAVGTCFRMLYLVATEGCYWRQAYRLIRPRSAVVTVRYDAGDRNEESDTVCCFKQAIRFGAVPGVLERPALTGGITPPLDMIGVAAPGAEE